jgi:hypothetical protein
VSKRRSSLSDQLREAMAAAVAALEQQSIDSRFLQFGGAGEPPNKKIKVPSDAFSEVLATRAMGDWAESVLANGIRDSCPAFRVIPYGDADRIAAGQPGFREFFLARSEEVRLYGKRPDLLIAPRNGDCPDTLAGLNYLDSENFARAAIAAIEVRSSKFEVFKYMTARAGASAKRSVKQTLSYTVKVEDLRIVYRWLERHPVPQIYCQVFFDAAFAISVLDILKIIGSSPRQYAIERDTANQMKSTIKIPVTLGKQIGVIEPPEFRAEHRVTALGRHDAYVVPTGGRARIDPQALCEILGLPLPPLPSAPEH